VEGALYLEGGAPPFQYNWLGRERYTIKCQCTEFALNLH
jgi:hypothetical protein